MLANLTCWVIALGLIFSNSIDRTDLYTKLVFAMGFILLGTISKAIDVYKHTHTIIVDEETAKELLSKSE